MSAEQKVELSLDNEIVKRVIDVAASNLGVRVADVKLDSNLEDDLGADSLDVVELVMALEDEFEMEISDADAENLKTIRQVAEYLISKNAE